MSGTPSHPHATPSHRHHPAPGQQPPITPTHQGLLPPLSPGGTPLPLDPNAAASGHYGHPPPPSGAAGGPAGHRGSGGSMGPPPNSAVHKTPAGAPPQGQMQPSQAGQGPMQGPGQGGGNVFGQVMGNVGQGAMGSPMHAMGAGNSKVYASVYSGIPVFEAMIRGISVMRRTADSWVNATQILKVAGIPKSARTKILEKEILPGVHEKVQGGYGKYQGTWIPFQRGQELAAQYGVTQYLAPIFEFVPTAANISSLPPLHETPDRTRTPGSHVMGYNPPMSAGRTPAPPSAAAQGRIYSPLPGHMHPGAHPHGGYANGGEGMMVDQLGYPIYYPPPGQMMGHMRDGLAPAADINGYGLPHGGENMYLDQYGHPQPMSNYISNGDEAAAGQPPHKRQRSEENQYLNGMEDEPMPDADAPAEGEGGAEGEGEDESSDDEGRDAPPLPAMMRLSNKPLRPKATVVANRARGKLLSLFNTNEAFDLKEVLGITATPTEWDIDMVIDSDGHTALHWACALGRMNVVTQLIELGADIHRGNYAGETPLIRSVLTTNHAESNTFPVLLEHLAPSIRTLDAAYRTIIHHIALIAGVKGRAGSARTYMTNVLEWVAKERAAAGATSGNNAETGSTSSAMSGSPTLGLKTLVDVQDVHGDTALNVAARVGNRGLVTLLLDAGADKAKMNKLGLKPADFGIEVEALRVSAAEAVVSSLKSEVPKPERHSRDVQKNIGAIFDTISDTFNNEMLQKQAKLNATEASVRHATKALADKRQQVSRSQSAVTEVEQIHQRSENIRRAMDTVTPSEWTGASLLPGESSAPAAFRNVPPPAAPRAVNGTNGHAGETVALPDRGTPGALIELRKIALWEDRIAALLQGRIQALQGESADKAVKYRKLVGLCTKVPVDKADGVGLFPLLLCASTPRRAEECNEGGSERARTDRQMLDGLVAAIESDGQSIDLSRISSFMSRMKEQSA